MKALVIGASGWLGLQVARALLDDGVEVAALEHGLPADPERPRGDLLDLDGLRRIIARQRPELVVHAAGCTRSDEGPGRYYRLHVEGTANLVEALRSDAPEAHLIALGSAAEYGSTGNEAPIAEDHPCHPVGPYGLSKKMQTDLLMHAMDGGDLTVTVLRLFNPIGPGMPPGFLLSDLFARLRELRENDGRSLDVIDLDAERDLVPLETICEAVVRSAGKRGPRGVLNVATGAGTRVGELVEWLREASDFEWSVRSASSTGRRSGGGRSVGDVTALARELGPLRGPSARDAVVAAYRAEMRGKETVQ